MTTTRRPRRVEPLPTALAVAAILTAWYVVAEWRLLPERFVPHPESVRLAFQETLTDSLYRVLVGFDLAVVTAVPLGLAIGYSTKVQAIFDPIVEFCLITHSVEEAVYLATTIIVMTRVSACARSSTLCRRAGVQEGSP